MTYFFHILVGFCMVVFHTTITPYSNLFSGFYDLLVILVIYLGFFRSPKEGIPFIIFFGIVMDVFSGGIFGLYATAYLWLYVAILGLTLFIRKNNVLLLPVIVLFGVIFENLAMIGITTVMDPRAVIPETVAGIIFGQAVWAFFTGPVLILGVKYVDDKLEKFAKSRENEFA